MIFVLFTLALAQAEPPATQNAQDPVATSAPAVTGVAPAAESDIPRGAPADDYGLVAWCRGALTGHMALYPVVEPELRSIEQPGEVAADKKADHEQMQAGRYYLALYARAMAAAEKASIKPIHSRGVEVRGQGEAIWTAASQAAPRTRMWSWLMWDLPGRCEIAAKRLEHRSGLLGEALRDAPAADQPAAPPESASPPNSIDDALKSTPAAPPTPDGAPALRGPQ